MDCSLLIFTYTIMVKTYQSTNLAPHTNSTSSEQSNATRGRVPIPVIVAFATLAALVCAFIVLYVIYSGYVLLLISNLMHRYLFTKFRHRTAGSDLESERAIGLKTFNSATPAQKYKQSKAKERYPTLVSSQLDLADVWYVSYPSLQ